MPQPLHPPNLVRVDILPVIPAPASSSRPPTRHPGASIVIPAPYPSSRRQHRHPGPPTRHSGASIVIPAPLPVIPAQASSSRPPYPSFRRQHRHPGPPTRHSGASIVIPAPLPVIPAQAGIYLAGIPPKSALRRRRTAYQRATSSGVIPAPYPSFRRKPESILRG